MAKKPKQHIDTNPPVGKRYGLLVLISTEKRKTIDGKVILLECRCDCGEVGWFRRYDLENHKTTRCLTCSKIEADKQRVANKYEDSRNAPNAYLYCIWLNGHIKIGYADSVRARLSEINVGNPYPAKLLWSIKGMAHLEEAWHLKLFKLG